MRFNLVKQLTHIAYFILLAILFYGCWASGITEIAARIVLWLLLISGLLLVLPGLIKGTQRSYIWLCFILMLYFVGSVQAVFASESLSMANAHKLALLITVVFTFITSMLTSRWYVLK